MWIDVVQCIPVVYNLTAYREIQMKARAARLVGFFDDHRMVCWKIDQLFPAWLMVEVRSRKEKGFWFLFPPFLGGRVGSRSVIRKLRIVKVVLPSSFSVGTLMPQ